MWGLAKLFPVLLAAKSSTFYEPKSAGQMVQDFRKFYEILGIENDKCVYKEASPTVKFYYVTPPSSSTDGNYAMNGNNGVKSWMDEDVMSQDIHMMEGNDNEDSERRRNVIHAVAEKYGTDKPIALYMPGLDGSGISAASWQFDDLSRTFELWRMSIGLQDRSSFVDLIKMVMDFCDELSSTTDRPIYLIGESFSGLLAPGVALQFQTREEKQQQARTGSDGPNKKKNPISGLVMINPATSFDRSSWDVAAPLLVTLDRLTKNNRSRNADGRIPFRLPSPYSLFGGLTLASMIPSSKQVESIVETIFRIPPPGANPADLIKTIEGYRDMFDLVGERIPSDLLEHRLKRWLMVGHEVINPRLGKLQTPALIVAGNDDKLLSSGKEINRLAKVLPISQKLVVSKAGHFVLDHNVNLTEAMIYSEILDPLNLKKKKERYDPILDWKLPSHDVIKESIEKVVKPLQQAHSPVFLSTDEHGKRHMGLGSVPREGPLVFVSNHQLLGLDLNLLVPKFLEENITVRGLAHPVLFQNDIRDELEGRQPGLTVDTSIQQGPNNAALFRRFGAVQVTPRNYYRLMQTGQNVLLFPGGAREVFHGRDEAYRLFWPEKVDFVRTAARFNATIIPLSAVGMADSVNMLFEPSEVSELPLIGERVKEFAANVTAARFDTDDKDEVFLPPIVAPSLPARNYFVFGKAVSTSDLDPKDRESCKRVYHELQREVERGFADILKARDTDPFKDTARRLAYERITGRTAPTFDLKQVNK